jgi:undecaprenyl pyrophosphate phosphatase UppP
VTASIVSLIVVRGFKDKIENDSILYLDYAWRIIIGLGCVPAIATIYLRRDMACLRVWWQGVAGSDRRSLSFDFFCGVLQILMLAVVPA